MMDFFSAANGQLPGYGLDYTSSLHQERMYLLSILAREESRAERYMLSLEATKAKLRAAEEVDDRCDADIVNLRKAASGIGRRLKNCQRTQKIMASNLVAVNSRLSVAEQHRWRRLEYQYRHHTQSVPHVIAGLQSMCFSPMAPDTPPSYTQQVQSPTSYLPGPPLPTAMTLNTTIPTSPATDPWMQGSPLYNPFYEQMPQHQYPYIPQLQQPQPGASTGQEENWGRIHGVRATDPFAQTSKSRTMSLPSKLVTTSNCSSKRSSTCIDRIPKHIERVESPDEAKSPGAKSSAEESNKFPMDLGRRLSLVGGSAAGLRLERLGSRPSFGS